jgi:hypothetical protein
VRAPYDQSHTPMTAFGMAAVAWLVGLAIYQQDGFYSRPGLLLVTAAIAVCGGTIFFRRQTFAERARPRLMIIGLTGALLVQVLLLTAAPVPPLAKLAIGLVGAMALLQVLDLKRWRLRIFALTLAAFVVVASAVFLAVASHPQIDVFMFQQVSANGLLHGANPYAIRFPNLYRASTPVYGPGVVDAATNTLTFGLPYPPLSLLLVLPAYVLAGDCRFADVVAIAFAAGLVAAVRPGRWNGLVAASFLLTPEVFYLVEGSWTEALMALTFSFVMFSALRWKAALPWALGLFFATKQTSVLAVPLVWILLDGPDRLRQYAVLMTKAALLALALTGPFFLWNPSAFWRSVVVYQFIQPQRLDALSHLVWMHYRLPGYDIVRWTPFALLVPATAFALWRTERSPAGFAAALTLVNLVFVAFNKQAFCNYYYFVIATALWAAAADDSPPAPAPIRNVA